MKKVLKIIGLLILIVLLFRGIIYRFTVHYSEIGTRAEIQISNHALIKIIEQSSIEQDVHPKEIVIIADQITSDILSFTTNKSSNNPNELIETKKANCVGYSALFNSIVNHIIRTNNLQEVIGA